MNITIFALFNQVGSVNCFSSIQKYTWDAGVQYSGATTD